MPHPRPLAAAGLIALAAPFAAHAAHAQPADPAVARVSAYGAAITRIAGSGAPVKARAERFLPVVRDAYDLSGALALIAGPAWASASAAERKAALDAFARLNAARHAVNFHEAGLVFAADPTAKPRGADRLVRARIGDETLIYRLRQTSGAWRILDVTARGVSQLALNRSDLASTVATGGVPALTRKLDELAER